MNRSRARRRRILPLALLLLLCVLAGGVFLLSRWHFEWFFRFGDGLRQRFLRAELTEVQPETVSVSREALFSDSRTAAEQSLMLVNAAYPLPAGFQAETGEYRASGVTVNVCLAEAYGALSDAVRSRYPRPLYVSSAYRTAGEQADAIASQGSLAAGVGESEHQAGLALDVYVAGYGGRSFLKTAEGRYVNGNAWRYGFTIRYPYGKTEVTGIAYEPWHLRYVGQPHAMILYQNSLTLEEYVASLVPGVFYRCGDWLISRQTEGETYAVPAAYDSVTVSPDNTGCLLLTFRAAA